MCPRRPATWAGSRAGPPVSECVSPGNPLPIERGRMADFLAVLPGGGGGSEEGRVVGATSNEGVMSVGFFSTTIIRKLPMRRVTIRSSFPICEHGSQASGQIPYL
jgi:hypothetical protein